jgi:hypothetical protein
LAFRIAIIAHEGHEQPARARIQPGKTGPARLRIRQR